MEWRKHFFKAEILTCSITLHCVYSAVNGLNTITELDNGAVDWPNTSSNRGLLSLPKCSEKLGRSVCTYAHISR